MYDDVLGLACLGGALNALEFQCAQRDNPLKVVTFTENTLQPVQGNVSERL